VRAFKAASEVNLRKAFEGEHKEEFRIALEKEQQSLKRVLQEVPPGDSDFEVAVQTAHGS